jgi:hypothetical protein
MLQLYERRTSGSKYYFCNIILRLPVLSGTGVPASLASNRPESTVHTCIKVRSRAAVAALLIL